MANDSYIEMEDRSLEDASAYQAEQERQSLCLEALTECVLKGVGMESLKTIQFEMGIDKKDFDLIVTQCLKIKTNVQGKGLATTDSDKGEKA